MPCRPGLLPGHVAKGTLHNTCNRREAAASLRQQPSRPSPAGRDFKRMQLDPLLSPLPISFSNSCLAVDCRATSSSFAWWVVVGSERQLSSCGGTSPSRCTAFHIHVVKELDLLLVSIPLVLQPSQQHHKTATGWMMGGAERARGAGIIVFVEYLADLRFISHLYWIILDKYC